MKILVIGAIHYSRRLAEALAPLLKAERASDDTGVRQTNSTMMILEPVSALERHGGKLAPRDNICRVGADGCE